MTLHEWLQTTYFTSNCCIDIVTFCDNGLYHQLETNEPALKDEPDFRFAKRFSEVTYKELEPYLDCDYESSYIYNILQFDLVIVEIKVRVKAREEQNV